MKHTDPRKRPARRSLCRLLVAGTSTLHVVALTGCGGTAVDEIRPESELKPNTEAAASDVEPSSSESPSRGAQQQGDAMGLEPVSEDVSAGTSRGDIPQGTGSGSSNPDGAEPTNADSSDADGAGVMSLPEPCVSLQPAGELELARRLERLFWNSDQGELVELVETGALSLDSPESIMAQASSMLDDKRARAGLNAFVRAWFDLGEPPLDFDKPLLGSVVESTDRTIDALVWGLEGAKPASVSALFAGGQAVVDAELAGFYDISPPTADWELVELPGPHRLGLLTQAMWLNANPNPPRRGTAVRRDLICQAVPPPPPGAPHIQEVPEGVSNREAYSQYTNDPRCSGCHNLIDPIGYGFEDFDARGIYRTEDAGRPIDASGEFADSGLTFDGMAGLRALLTGELGPEVQRCLVGNAVGYAVGDGRGGNAYAVSDLSSGCSSVSDGLSDQGLEATLQEWLLAIVASDVFGAQYP